MALKTTLIISGLLVFHAVSFIAVTLWLLRRSRRGRAPFRQDESWLRRPGQGLEERLTVLDEKLSTAVWLGLGVPPAIFLVLVVGLLFVPRWSLVWVLLLILLAVVVSFVVRVKAVIRLVDESRRVALGLAGERCVADHLQILWHHGFRIFHDIPVLGATGPFNIDHVVLGRSGVFVIETKARRKPNEKAQDDDHKVSHDGQYIYWPWGKEEDSVQQARDNAKWVYDAIRKDLGIEVEVQPIVAIPSWYVTPTDEKKKTEDFAVWITNPKRIPRLVSRAEVLQDRDFDLIGRWLDRMGRLVEPPTPPKR